MTLENYCHNLSEQKRINLAIQLAKLTLPIWNAYVENNKLEYRDTIVGMHHIVNGKLLKRTIEAVEKYTNVNKLLRLFKNNTTILILSEEFSDPVVALQDSDWELPQPVKLAFYSVYNLLEYTIGKKTTLFKQSTIYVSINQSIDALNSSGTMTFEEVKELLDKV